MKDLKILARVIDQTEAALVSFHGVNGPNEGLVYWAGVEAYGALYAIAAFVPNANAKPYRIETSPQENAAYTRWLRGNGLIHIAQIHSHPPGVHGHSEGDDLYAFAKSQDLYSIVVNNYACNGMQPLKDHAVEVCTGQDFLLLDSKAVDRCISIIDGFFDRRESQNVNS